jgi:subtilisin family serine protease
MSLNHPEFAGRITKKFNAISATKSAEDDNGHGSHVGGIAGAADNTEGVVGVANQCNFFAVKVLSKNGMGWLSDIIEGIDWAVANGADVINMSLGGGENSAEETSVNNAVNNAGVVVVAAAGNDGDGSNAASYPGAYPSVICVGSTDSNDALSYFSTTGPQLDIAAPGRNIKSCWKGTGYNTISGTSMATPHVAGGAALVIAQYRSANGGADPTVDFVKWALYSTADDLGTAGIDEQFGNGLLDVQQAVTGSESIP